MNYDRAIREAFAASSQTYQKPLTRRHGNEFARLACENPQTYVKVGGACKEGVVVPARCGVCPNCLMEKKNDLLGICMAASLVSARIDLITLSFDGQTPESLLGTLVRDPSLVQKFIKRLRADEVYQLSKYNEKERTRAMIAGREPELIPEVSHLEYLAVYELGTKNKRGHWHVLLFWKTHFPVPLDVLAKGSQRETAPHLKRVVDIETMAGPKPLAQPPEAGDENVLSYRVEKSQLWRFWPHGFVNVECVSHATEDPHGLLRKKPEDLMKAVKYCQQYLYPAPVRSLDRKHVKNADRMAGKLRKEGDTGAKRTYSLSLGKEYAHAAGVRHAMTGLPVKHLRYELVDVNMPLDRVKEHNRRSTMTALTNNPITAETLIRRSIVFVHRGSRADTYCRAYLSTMEQRGRATETGKEFGEEIVKYKLRTLARETVKLVNSLAYQAAVEFQGHVKKALNPIYSEITPIPVFRVLEDGTQADGRWRVEKDGMRRRVAMETLTPVERFDLATKRHDRIQSEAAKVYLPKSEHEAELLRLSALPFDELTTEWHWKERKRLEKAAMVDALSQRSVKRAREKLADMIRGEDPNEVQLALCALDKLDALCVRTDLEPCTLPRNQFGHPTAGVAVVEAALNTSLHGFWPEKREQAVKRYCKIIAEGDGWQVIRAPAGEVLMRRSGFSEQKITAVCPDTGTLIKHKGRAVWFCKQLQTDGDIDAAMKGEGVVHKERLDPIFVGSRYLQSVT